MFKQLTLKQILAPTTLDIDTTERSMREAAYQPACARQEKSLGWCAPRGHAHAALLEAIDGQWLAMFVIETRAVPPSAVDKRVREIAAQIERQDGRRPGKKELRSLRADAKDELLPNAFSKTERVPVWIDPVAMKIAIGTTSSSKLDEVVTALVRCIANLQLAAIGEPTATAAAMRHWLTLTDEDSMPGEFELGTECVLRSQGTDRATARFTNQILDCAEVRQNVMGGKLPISLALQWPGRLSLVMGIDGRLNKIRLEVAPMDRERAAARDGLDADFTLFTREMCRALAEVKAAVDSTVRFLTAAEAASKAAIDGIAAMWGDLPAAAAGYNAAASSTANDAGRPSATSRTAALES